jgi:hypothetical protein
MNTTDDRGSFMEGHLHAGEWDGVERRKGHPAVRHDDATHGSPAHTELMDAIHSIRDDLNDHIRAEETFFKSAFVGGDPVSHRADHEAQRAAALAKKAFYDKLRDDLARDGIKAVIVVLIGLMLFGLYVKLGVRPPMP